MFRPVRTLRRGHRLAHWAKVERLGGRAQAAQRQGREAALAHGIRERVDHCTVQEASKRSRCSNANSGCGAPVAVDSTHA